MNNSVYERLGVRRVINCTGPTTVYGGGPIHPQVMEAMVEASRWRVDIKELLDVAGKRIAMLTGTPAAYVTSGAAAGLLLSTAACVAGKDPINIVRLPDTTGMKNEVIIEKKHRFSFDHAIRNVGVNLKEVGWSHATTQLWEMEAEINEKTAAIAYVALYETDASIPLREVVELGNRLGIPVIVDAGPNLPPVGNLSKFTDMGADLVCFSGGKAIGGPQGTGIILGRKDLIEACALNSNPYHNSIGRPLKVSKEDIVGLVTALELYVYQDHDKELETWRMRTKLLVDKLSAVPGLVVWEEPNALPGVPVPVVYMCQECSSDEPWLETVIQELAEGAQAIRVLRSGDTMIISPHAMTNDETELVASRLIDILLHVHPPTDNLHE